MRISVKGIYMVAVGENISGSKRDFITVTEMCQPLLQISHHAIAHAHLITRTSGHYLECHIGPRHLESV